MSLVTSSISSPSRLPTGSIHPTYLSQNGTHIVFLADLSNLILFRFCGAPIFTASRLHTLSGQGPDRVRTGTTSHFFRVVLVLSFLSLLSLLSSPFPFDCRYQVSDSKSISYFSCRIFSSNRILQDPSPKRTRCCERQRIT